MEIIHWPNKLTSDEELQAPVALVFSGDGYLVNEPVLYGVSNLLSMHGFNVIGINWAENLNVISERRNTISSIVKSLDSKVIDRVCLIVGFSSGCVANELFPEIPVILFSPITINGDASLQQKINSKNLVFKAENDNYQSEEKLIELGCNIQIITNANHAMEVEHDWCLSIKVLEEILSIVEKFIENLEK